MKISNRSIFIAFVSLTILVSGCAPAATPVPPKSTPLHTNTPKTTNTPSPTATPVPTKTPTSLPYFSSYEPVPRWMILGLPGQHIEIMGEIWNYRDYRLGETYGCMDYKWDTGTNIYFEQCFGLIDKELTFESVQSNFLADGFEALEPDDIFGSVGQISLLGKRLTGMPQKTIEFYEVIGTEKYILLVELYIETDKIDPIQAIYESEVSDIMDYVLQYMLEKSRLIPRPTATPLSPTQESIYATLEENLITESEVSPMYGNKWEAIGDFVDPENPMMCRDFESRANADVLWVKFSNCILLHHPNTTFDNFAENFKKPENIFLESRHQFDDKLILYYRFPKLYAWLWMNNGRYVYSVELESRTIHGENNVENNFTKEVDDFIYSVLMKNTNQFQAQEDVLFSDDFSTASSGWDQVNEDFKITDYDNGGYRMWLNETQYDIWANPSEDFSCPVSVEVDARMVAGPEDNDFGIICNYQDVDNYYVGLVSSDGYAVIMKRQDGTAEYISSDQMVAVDGINSGSANNHLRFECNNGDLTLYANGKQVAYVYDNSFSGGDVGLQVGTFDEGGVDFLFDNFVVYTP